MFYICVWFNVCIVCTLIEIIFLENPPGVPTAPRRSTPSKEPTTPGGQTSSEKLICSSDLDDDMEADLKQGQKFP